MAVLHVIGRSGPGDPRIWMILGDESEHLAELLVEQEKGTVPSWIWWDGRGEWEPLFWPPAALKRWIHEGRFG